MTKEMIYDFATIAAEKVTTGNGWVAYEFTRTNRNGVTFFYDVTIYDTGLIDVFKLNLNTYEGCGWNF